MTVREASASDWQRWRALRLRALADAPDAFGETLPEALTRDETSWIAGTAPRPDAIRLLAGDDAGMMVVAVDPAHAGRAHVYAMWVAPEVRGRGVGRALVDAGLEWARDRAAIEVSLRVSETRVPARRLYERCGFVDSGRREPLRPGSEQACHVMVVRLPVLVMGVVNVTPDSFSDGGAYLAPEAAVAHGHALLAAGADILDVGGEATNPRARPIDATEELRRVLPVIEQLATAGARVSIDTTKAAVARRAVSAGASIVNDVAGGLFDSEMARAIDELGVTYIAGHLRGTSLAEVFAAEAPVGWRVVAAELATRLATLSPASRARAWVDPGVGFGKGADPAGNVALLEHAGAIATDLGRPIVVGPSRKRFLHRLLGAAGVSAEAIDAASVLASLAAVRAGAAVVRAHNVALLRTGLTAYKE